MSAVAATLAFVLWITPTPRPGWDWNGAFAYADTHDGRTVEERRELRDALAYFRSALGEDWCGWRTGAHLATQFFLSYQGGPSEGAQLFRDLSLFPHQDVLDLARRLGQSGEAAYGAAKMELGFAAAFRRTGRDVQFVPAGHGRRTPDLRVRIGGRWVAVECKRMRANKDARESDEVFIRLFELERFYRKTVRGCLVVRFDNACRGSRARRAIDEILLAAQTLVEQREGARVLPGLCELRFRSADGPLAVSYENGLVYDQFEEPAAQKDMRRAGTTAREKASQLSTEEPGVLVLRAHALSLPGPFSADALRPMAALLGGKLADLPMVSAVLLYEQFLGRGTGKPVLVEEERYSGFWGSVDGRIRAALLVLNPGARLPLRDEERHCFVGRGMVW